MFTFKFKVNEDQSVDIYGMQTGSTKEIAGAGQTWRAWHKGGHGYQSGRQWMYGSSSIWIVQVSGDTMLKYFDFEFGRKWKAGRKIIAQIVERLNQNPDANHAKYLFELEKATRDWEREQLDIEPIERLKRAITMHCNNVL